MMILKSAVIDDTLGVMTDPTTTGGSGSAYIVPTPPTYNPVDMVIDNTPSIEVKDYPNGEFVPVPPLHIDTITPPVDTAPSDTGSKPVNQVEDHTPMPPLPAPDGGAGTSSTTTPPTKKKISPYVIGIGLLVAGVVAYKIFKK